MYVYEIKFLNWEKFNPKLRNKNAVPTWFRFDLDIWEHPAMYGQSPNRQLLFVYAMARSTKRVGVACLTSREVYHRCALQHRHVAEALAHWENLGIIEYKISLIQQRTADRQDRQTDKTDCNTSVDAAHADDEPTPKPKLGKVSPGGSGRPSVAAPDYSGFVNLWNSKSGALRKVDSLNDERKRKIKSRLLENPDLAYWENCVVKMAASHLCVDGKWATFDWLIKNDTNHRKVTEGNYDDREPIPFRRTLTDNSDLMARLQKIADEG